MDGPVGHDTGGASSAVEHRHLTEEVPRTEASDGPAPSHHLCIPLQHHEEGLAGAPFLDDRRAELVLELFGPLEDPSKLAIVLPSEQRDVLQHLDTLV